MTKLLKVLNEVDSSDKDELVANAKKLLDTGDAKIHNRLAESLGAIREALLSKEEGQINRAVLDFRRSLSELMPSEGRSGSDRVPPILTPKLAKNFLAACEGEINSRNRAEITVFFGDKSFNDSPASVLRRIGAAHFGGSVIKAGRYVSLVAKGRSHANALAEVNSEVGPSALPEPPNLTQDFATKFIEACGGRVSSSDTARRSIIIDGQPYEDSPLSLLNRIGKVVFDTKFAFKLSNRYLTLISQGKSHVNAVKIINKETKNPVIPLPDPPNLTKDIAKAFLEASGGAIAGRPSSERIKISVGGIDFDDSALAVIQRIAGSHFSGSYGSARRYFKLIADGKKHSKALKEINEWKSDQAPPLPNPPNLTQSFARAFIDACGGTITSSDTKHYRLEIDGESYEDSPRNLLERIGRILFGDKEAFATAIRYINLVAHNNESHDRAVKLAQAGQDATEEMEILDQIDELQILELFSIFSDRPGQLKLSILAKYPKLTEKEINKLIIRGFKSFFGGSRKKDAQYQEYSEVLPPITLTQDPPSEIEDSVIKITGIAPQAEMVYIGGISSRRYKVATNGSFTIELPLKIGQRNQIILTAVDTINRTRNHPLVLDVDQIGEVDPIEELIEQLSGMGKEAIAAIQVDPGKYEYLKSRSMHMMLSKFSKDFHSGEQYMRTLIDGNHSKVIKKMLKEILKEFQRINVREFSNILPERPLYFFQKFAADRIEKKMLLGATGYILAGEAGLGKTCTSLAAINGRDAVVVSPNSVVSGWSEEVAKCMKNPDFLVMQDMPHSKRKEILKTETARHRITNIQFLQKHEDDERFDLLMGEDTILVHDEAHTRANLGSDQTKGMIKLAKRAKFQLLISATIFKNPKSVRRVFHTLYPDREEFTNDAAFTKAFPPDDPDALKTLNLMIEDDILRLTKRDVLEEMDPKISVKKQIHKLPRKDLIPPEKMGTFEMHEEQADVIYEMMLDWRKWTKKYGHYFPKDEVAKLDHLRYGDALSKRHAYRQVVNDPAFVGLNNLPNRKAWLTQKIVQQSLAEGRKVEIFSAYNRQTQIYADILQESKPALYTGITSKEVWRRNSKGKPILYRKDERGRWIFDKDGYPVEDAENGEAMLAMDFERLTFQNAPQRKVVLATYAAGAVGTTFTAAKTVIKDDLPRDCIEDEQADDRTHRIDHEHQTHHSVKYFHLISTYPKSFLEKMKKKWVVKQGNDTYKEYSSAASAQKDRSLEKGKLPKTAYETFFEQGTWDQVHYGNLQVQRRMMHLILDGIGDESILAEEEAKCEGIDD